MPNDLKRVVEVVTEKGLYMKKFQKENLLITPSLFTLFLYLLLNDRWQKSDYVLNCRIPQVIHDNLRDAGAAVYTDYLKDKGNTVFDKLKQNITYWQYLFYSKNFVYANVYGNDEFYLSMKYRNIGIKIVEDSPYFNNRQLLKKRRLKLYAGLLNYWFYWIFKDYVPFGFDSKVSVIYHTTFNQLPDEIAHKGIPIDMKQLWQNKSEEEKQSILMIFGVEPTMVNNIGKYKTVLVTEVLPIPDNEKIDIYKSLLQDNEIKQSELLIKTHYAEKTDYRKAFPEATIINTPVPAQLLDVMGYVADKAITISSTAIFAFVKPQTQIIFKGTGFDERLKRVLGVIRLEDIVK